MEVTICVAMIFAGVVDQYFMVPKRRVGNRLVDFAITSVWIVMGGIVGFLVPMVFRVTNTITLPCVVAMIALVLGVVAGRAIIWATERRARSVARRAFERVETERKRGKG